jgi:hypothetical protein
MQELMHTHLDVPVLIRPRSPAQGMPVLVAYTVYGMLAFEQRANDQLYSTPGVRCIINSNCQPPFLPSGKIRLQAHSCLLVVVLRSTGSRQ